MQIVLLLPLAACLVSTTAPSPRLDPAVGPALQHLDRLRQHPSNIGSVVDACLTVCRAVPGPRGVNALPADAQQLREAAAFFDFAGGGDFGQHLFDVELWDDVLGQLAKAVASEEEADHAAQLAAEAAAAVSAAVHFVASAPAEKGDAICVLESIVASDTFLDARRAALAAIRERRAAPSSGGSSNSRRRSGGAVDNVDAFFAAARERRRKQDYVAVAATANDDVRVIEALYASTVDALGPTLLEPLGFPSSKLGLRCFVGANRLGGSQRAAATLGTIWHAAYERAPLIVQELSSCPVFPPPSVSSSSSSFSSSPSPSSSSSSSSSMGPKKSAATLVIVFSSLGWNGVVRAEWGATLKTVGDESSLVVAHALDTAQSWFQTSPESGEYDGGAWWDERLAALCEGYDRVCILGESMGATGALRFARHATESVVALVPQIDVRDFDYSGRADFSEGSKEELVGAIQAACRETAAQRIVLHVGQDPPDLRQLSYLPEWAVEQTAEDAATNGPLGSVDSRMRVVRHAVPGHALGAGLKERGLLKRTVLRDLLGHTYRLPAAGATGGARAA